MGWDKAVGLLGQNGLVVPKSNSVATYWQPTHGIVARVLETGMLCCEIAIPLSPMKI